MFDAFMPVHYAT